MNDDAKAKAYDEIIAREEAKAGDRADRTNWHALYIDRTHALERVERERDEAHEAFEATRKLVEQAHAVVTDADVAGRALVAALEAIYTTANSLQAAPHKALVQIRLLVEDARTATTPTHWRAGEETKGNEG